MIMIDVEAIGPVVQIGACKFDPSDQVLLKDTDVNGFIENISIASSLKAGLAIDPSELQWWFQRGGKPDWLNSPIDIRQALGRFREWMDRKQLVISHNYDMAKLQMMYDAIGERIPFPYRNWRDIRTIMWLADIKTPKDKEGDPKTHNALEDCWFQIKYVSEALRKLKGDADGKN